MSNQARKKIKKTIEPPTEQPTIIELIQYNAQDYQYYNNLTAAQIVEKVNGNLVNWINIDGGKELDMRVISEAFQIHFLIMEDITSDHQPKMEEHDNFIFFTMKMLYKIEKDNIEFEQISFVLGNHFLLTFQEKPGDPFDGFRERLRADLGVARKMKADYLMYRLLDIVVDRYFHIFNSLGTQLEEIEEQILERASQREFIRIQLIKKELIFLRRALFPLRESLKNILKGESPYIQEDTLKYFSDIYDQIIYLTDSLDTYRELTSSLMDICMNALNTKMNEVMKVLTVISTIFIPLTFIVGVYGMNFDYMPELRWHYGYPIIVGIMLLIVLGMIRYFKYRKWF